MEVTCAAVHVLGGRGQGRAGRVVADRRLGVTLVGAAARSTFEVAGCGEPEDASENCDLWTNRFRWYWVFCTFSSFGCGAIARSFISLEGGRES